MGLTTIFEIAFQFATIFDDLGPQNMKPSEWKKAVKTVGSEKVLEAMLLQIANVWDAMFLDGFAEHISAGTSAQSFFSNKNGRYGDEKSPLYFEVKRRLFHYKVTIGICFGGTCGEGAEFKFSRKFELMENGPANTWIH
jgi:hypothetical protein